MLLTLPLLMVRINNGKEVNVPRGTSNKSRMLTSCKEILKEDVT